VEIPTGIGNLNEQRSSATVPDRGRLVNVSASACAVNAWALMRSVRLCRRGDELEGDGLRPAVTDAVRRAGGACRKWTISWSGVRVLTRVYIAAESHADKRAFRQPASMTWRREPGEERQPLPAVEAVEQPPPPGEVGQQVLPELDVRGDPSGHQFVAGAEQHPQPEGFLAGPGSVVAGAASRCVARQPVRTRRSVRLVLGVSRFDFQDSRIRVSGSSS
jgi:hypothetical protein